MRCGRDPVLSAIEIAGGRPRIGVQDGQSVLAQPAWRNRVWDAVVCELHAARVARFGTGRGVVDLGNPGVPGVRVQQFAKVTLAHPCGGYSLRLRVSEAVAEPVLVDKPEEFLAERLHPLHPGNPHRTAG